uniref:Transmembrane protein n=1 Tax=Rhabditophanes sp. KR3021 TaxID=114890 RepID=A0AC35TK20_9BILA
MDTAWGTDFDLAVLGNVLKKRFGIFYPSLNGKSYNFSMILPGSQSQTWPLVFLHNTNLNHFGLIQNLATPNQPFEVQDEEEFMEIDSDKNMSFVEENPIPMSVEIKNFLSEKKKKNTWICRQRRELNDMSPVKQIVSSRAQRAAARSLVCQSKIDPAITKSNIKKSIEPQIAKTVTKCCARNPNKIPLQHTLGKLNAIRYGQKVAHQPLNKVKELGIDVSIGVGILATLAIGATIFHSLESTPEENENRQ